MKLEDIKDIRPVVEGSQNTMGQLVSTEQAAKIIGVSDSRVRQFVGDGRLTPQQTTDSDHYFKREDVEALKRKPRKRTGRPKGSKNEDND